MAGVFTCVVELTAGRQLMEGTAEMANRYSGSYRELAKGSDGTRGVARALREEKRIEARKRNRATLPYRTRQHRRECMWTTHDSSCLVGTA